MVENFVGLKNAIKRKRYLARKKCKTKAMIKSFAKKKDLFDQMALPWPNTTKLPLGVTMVLVSQVPK